MSDLLDFSPPGQATFTLAGAKAYFYDAGTTNARTVYTDQTEAVAHPSPLVADANGMFAQAFTSGGTVKVVVTRSDDSTGYTLDPCEKVAAAGSGASQVSFSPTVALPFTDVQAAIEGAAASAASGFTPYGLGVSGSVSLIADMNATTTATGQYRFDNTATGTFPTGVAAADTGAVRIEREAAGSAWMWLYHDASDRTFFRRMNASAWGTWREVVIANQGAAEGDILYRSSTNWTRLAKGTAGQLLTMNPGATAPQWSGSAPGSAPVYAPRAWARYSKSVAVTIHGSGNIASISDAGTGISDVTFTTAMPDANYAVIVQVGLSGIATGVAAVTSIAGSGFRIQTNRVSTDAATDSANVSFIVLR